MTLEIFHGSSFYRFELMDFDSVGAPGTQRGAQSSKIHLVERLDSPAGGGGNNTSGAVLANNLDNTTVVTGGWQRTTEIPVPNAVLCKIRQYILKGDTLLTYIFCGLHYQNSNCKLLWCRKDAAAVIGIACMPFPIKKSNSFHRIILLHCNYCTFE